MYINKKFDMSYTMTIKAIENKEEIINKELNTLINYIQNNKSNIDIDSIEQQLVELTDFVESYNIY